MAPPAPAPPTAAAAAAGPTSTTLEDRLEAAAPTPTTRTTSHSHHPSYAYFSLQRLDEATLRRLNAPPPALPPPQPPTMAAPPVSWGQGLREALAAGHKVAMPVLLFMAVGCCHLIGWGLLVYGTFAVAASSASPSTPPSSPGGILPIGSGAGGGGTRQLLREGHTTGLGFVLYMASVLACGVWLHGYIRRKREAHGGGGLVRSPGPMGA